MMRILMRTNMWPEGIFSPGELMAYDRIGSNIGNMLFPFSIGRWLMGVEDIEIDPIRDSEVTSAQNINENYDMLLLPFANAFRKEFIPFLKDWTNLIRTLTIPCVVIGIGAQAKVGDEILQFAFDQDVKDFCDAVLERSTSIGVRGEITKKYLMQIGVQEECIHVIGCPSMFVNGSDYIEIEKKPFEEVKQIALNTSKAISGKAIVTQWMAEYDKAIFIPQETWELVALYTGFQSVLPDQEYILNTMNAYYRAGRIHSFIDTLSWLSYFHHTVDISAGTRIHGNVAALMAGVPALVIACDTRVQEISEFFSIPYRSVEEVIENPSLEEWYRQVDFSAMKERYPKALQEYEAFWKENGIPYLLPDQRVNLKKQDEILDIVSMFTLKEEEKIEQIQAYFSQYDKRWKERFDFRGRQIQWFRRLRSEMQEKTKQDQEEIKSLKTENQDLKKENKNYSRQLDKAKKELDYFKNQTIFQYIKYRIKKLLKKVK